MPPALSVDERAYARLMHDVEKWGPCKIARKIGKQRKAGVKAPSHSAVSRLINKKSFPISGERKKPSGRKRRTTKEEDDALMTILADLQEKYGDEMEITAPMCLARWKTKADKDHNKDPEKPKVAPFNLRN